MLAGYLDDQSEAVSQFQVGAVKRSSEIPARKASCFRQA
jgi:hypothetical protein